MNNTKKLIIFLVLIFLISNVKAEASNSTLFIIPYTSDEFTHIIENNIFTTLQIENDENRIIEIETTLNNNDYNTNTGIVINLSNNYTYTVQTQKFTWYLIPYENITHTLTFRNYTIFNQTKTVSNILQYDIKTKITYDIQTGKTKFYTSSGFDYNSSLQYTTNKFNGLPAELIIFNGLTIFDIKIKNSNIGSKISILEKKNKLSTISGIIYDIITLHIPIIDKQIFDDNETLLNLFLFLDLFFSIVYIVFAIIFIYTYLILIWIISIVNIISCYKANTTKEFIVNMTEYYKIIINAFYNMIIPIINIIIRLINGLINAISNLIP